MALASILRQFATAKPWAKDGDRTEPEDRTPAIDRATGWTATYSETGGAKPSRRVFNQLFYELSLAISELVRKGVLDWDSAVAYEHPAFVVSSGTVYQSLRDNTAKPPASSPADWATWPPPVPAATTASAGSVELATNAEAAAGTDAAKVVTPAGLAAYRAASGNAATDSAQGFVRLATAAEVAAKSGGGVVTVTQAASIVDAS